MKQKTCRKCGKEKSASEFYRQGPRGHYSSWCKECHRTWSREQASKGYYVANRKRKRALSGKPPRRRLSPIENTAAELYRSARARSTRNGRIFELDQNLIEDLVKEFCGKNYYCLEPRHPFRPSLDKINPASGYTKENVRIIWLIENLARNTFTEDQLIEFCKRKLGLI